MEPGHDTPPRIGPATEESLPRLAVIAAVAANAVIGDGNRLPWHLADDLKRFRALTTGHAVIMGRRTWESIGRPLPSRQNIVVTSARGYAPAGAQAAGSLTAALALVRMPAPAFCIGGGMLYREALPLATTLYLTEIDHAFPGDTTFPVFDRRGWRETAREAHISTGPDRFGYAFVTYERLAH